MDGKWRRSVILFGAVSYMVNQKEIAGVDSPNSFIFINVGDFSFKNNNNNKK